MKKNTKKRDKADFTYYQGSSTRKCTLVEQGDVRIKLMVERICPLGLLMRDCYFKDGKVLHCYRGRFRFTLEGCAPIVVGEGETIVIYPDQYVSIEALDKVNLLIYVIFEGNGVSFYFDQFGFFNGIHGRTSAQLEIFREVKHALESTVSTDTEQLTIRLSDILVTYAHDLLVGANAVVCDAIRQIRTNIENGVVRLTPLYDQLRIGHTTLNEAFKRAGIGRPAEFIRQEQFRRVKELLRNTRKPIAAIAEETGFISATHFANFVKRNTGMTASEFRRGGRIVKSR